ncbi:kinetochore-associated Ndc80 complex subunit spc25 [Malassezia vespertilionis]|uniref:Kinetochore protein SPC25 n=1 Tax=Malassezia vespertilionis TaxID=2020962 RepID=A0A2N1JCR6_9BASI|nr:kinetochore-associated Ndc80 complex subunit spc25 [Malassezia vespertilionis]PKI84371.1 Spc25p [Malassezia vespertilionis]WFD06268.1 kinetochore-associated Ndc80 complex subunit spc25 [Malassezia vespertilionis]
MRARHSSGASRAVAPVLDFSDLEASIENFTRRFEMYVQSTVASCDQDRLAADTQRAENQVRIKSLEAEREDTKTTQKELWETVASERSADAKLRASVQALLAQRTSLAQRSANLQIEVGELRAQIIAQRERKQGKVQQLREQVQRNAPELAQLERTTGLQIRPQERGTIQFTFSLLTASSPETHCAVVVDVSQEKYTVPHHDDLLSETALRSLLRQLNQTGDFHAFLKGARHAMQKGLVDS